ncbi:MAG: hypothetical protein KJO34_10430, partial [Deltaproteobacteria bacterium]|nr:hypothetical protein [Deltaproteobacteria bacterium]
LNGLPAPSDIAEDEIKVYVEILKQYYLFDKESKDHALAKSMIANAGLEGTTGLFPLLVKLKVFG